MKLEWKLLGLAAALAVPLAAAAAPVLVARGTVSTPNAAEAAFAARTAERVSRWLTATAVPHVVVDDGALSARLAGRAGVAILPYNPDPPAAVISALTAFTARGGRVIVCYSSSPALADLLDVELGHYKAFRAGGRWSAFRFSADTTLHVPRLLRQDSRNIRVALPLAERSRVIAEWLDPDLRPTGDPAWLQGRRGLWMTHVLLDDADEAAKARMLLGMIASYDASVWPPAARHILEQSSELRPGQGFAASLAELDALAATARDPGAVRRGAAAARELRERLQAWLAAGEYGRVVETAGLLSSELTRAFALAQPAPRPGERRAVWDHHAVGLYPGDWNRTARELARAGVTDVFLDVLWPGFAHFEAPGAATSDAFREFGDQLDAAARAGKAHGIDVHAWKICWRLDRAGEERIGALGREGRLIESVDGATKPWMCPTDPRNRREELEAVVHAATRPGVAGVHLDYIRFPDPRACYCDGCRKRFGAQTGQPTAPWPAVVRAAPGQDAFRRWRAESIDGFVRDCRSAMRKRAPGVQLSAAVYGKYPSCVQGVGQDWARWVREGWVDFVCPMNYSTDLGLFSRYVGEQSRLVDPRRVWPGIGFSAAESRLSPVQMLDQARVSREAGMQGFAIFDLNRRLELEALPALRLGLR